MTDSLLHKAGLDKRNDVYGQPQQKKQAPVTPPSDGIRQRMREIQTQYKKPLSQLPEVIKKSLKDLQNSLKAISYLYAFTRMPVAQRVQAFEKLQLSKYVRLLDQLSTLIPQMDFSNPTMLDEFFNLIATALSDIFSKVQEKDLTALIPPPVLAESQRKLLGALVKAGTKRARATLDVLSGKTQSKKQALKPTSPTPVLVPTKPQFKPPQPPQVTSLPEPTSPKPRLS